MALGAAERRRLHAAVLELLERRHGVGTRGAGVGSWMQLRLDRALEVLAADLDGSPERVLDLLRDEPNRLEEIAELLRVGETRFFRDPPQWQALGQTGLPALAGRDRVRALSVGCSTGEEAWTLAILLDDVFGRPPSAAKSLRVVGMDRSEAALAAAREAVYPEDAARQVPSELAGRYLERAPSGDLRVAESLRPTVTFVARDAMIGPPPGHYELIVCKNLLIYFGHEAAARAVELLFGALAEGGLLMVARSEVPRVRALGHEPVELAAGVLVFRGR